MITDRIQLAGLDSYFQEPANSRNINLGGLATTTTFRTDPIKKGMQIEISSLQLLIEHADLQNLMSFQFDNKNPPRPAPILKVSVMKEMFSGLFADPYSHRVHNIAGYLDFREGTLTNGRIMEIDGIPTIVSSNKGECKWVSKEYIMPEPIAIAAIAWELATSKLSPADSFNYKINIICKKSKGGLPYNIDIPMMDANDKRAIDGLPHESIDSFQIIFSAIVFKDSNISERHLPINQNIIDEKIGRPLLRAINILEPIKSSYEVFSLLELGKLSNGFQLFTNPGPAITRLATNIALGAVLVFSENEDLQIGKYEYLELKLFPNEFTKFEVQKNGVKLLSVK